MTELSWTFNGGASLEINEKMFEEFWLYIQKKHLAIKGKDVRFSDDKIEKLQSLIKENEELKQKIQYANQLIEEHKDKKLIETEERSDE